MSVEIAPSQEPRRSSAARADAIGNKRLRYRPAALAGDFSSAAYTLSHMAADAVGLLDALELDAVHVVGASLGGAIAQTMAIEHPARILSLTSMMSTTGNMTVGQAHPETLKAVFGGPRATTMRSPLRGRLSHPFRQAIAHHSCKSSMYRRS